MRKQIQKKGHILQGNLTHNNGTLSHLLLGKQLKSGSELGSHVWEIDLGIDLFPYLKDHCFQGMVVLPGGVYVEMALAAAATVYGKTPCILQEIEFQRVLFLSESGTQSVQLNFRPSADGGLSFYCYSRSRGEKRLDDSKTLHARGKIPNEPTRTSFQVLDHTELEEIRARCPEEISGKDFYTELRERGTQYGPNFQGVERLWGGVGEALGKLRIPKALEPELRYYHLHPALLDTCTQVLTATNSNHGRTSVLVGIDQIRIYGSPGIHCWSHAHLLPNAQENANTLVGNVRLLDEFGQVVIELLGIHFQYLEYDRERFTLENQSERALAISATFTAEPVEESLNFWSQELEIPFKVQFAPYNQVFQQLLDPSSLIRKNENGMNVILVRFEDWIRNDSTELSSPYPAENERMLNNRLQGKGFEPVVDKEDLPQDSGLHSIFATQQSKREEPSKRDSLTTEKQEKVKDNVKNLVLALRSASEHSSTPHLVCVCPASPEAVADRDQMVFYKQMEDLMVSELGDISNVHPVSSSELTAAYPISTYYDPHGDELGHVPYTPAFFAALGTMIARKFHATQSAPYKVVVLDCDQTLWKGICGEDGPLGIEIDLPRRKLQEFMIEQLNAGMLICLCSKNSEEDVMEVFHHREMPLKRDHIVSWRINWKPKSENIKSLANELQLGLDSFIFIDDSPVECREVQANCPQVLTLQLPKEADDIPRFLKHIWAFDHLKITDEDQKRTTLYQQNIKREHFREESLTLGDFLAGLKLEVRIFKAMQHHLSRVSQLTQRTNQFNCTTIRRSEAEVRKLLQSGALECLVVEVSDRFGEYGLVGVILFTIDSEAIKVDTFLLSCRVLGRGVEHRMLARLGEIANEHGLSYVEVPYIPTKRNQPALDFLDGIGSKHKDQLDNGFLFKLPTEYAMTIAYTPGFEESKGSGELAGKTSSSSQISRKQMAQAQAKSERLGHIAANLYSAEQILGIIESQRCKQRPDLPDEYVAPGNELERSIASIWQKVLGIEKVGVRDNFFEVGGTSLKGIRLIAQLKRDLDIDISVVNLFESPTISSITRMLGKDNGRSQMNKNMLSSRQRGEKRRAKRRLRKR